MRTPNPSLDQSAEFSRFPEQLGSLGFRGHRGVVVVNDVSFAPAGVEVVGQRSGLRAYCQVRGVKGDGMVPGSRADSIPGTRDRHLPRLQSCVISRGEAAIGGEAGQSSISEIARDQSSDVCPAPAGWFGAP